MMWRCPHQLWRFAAGALHQITVPLLRHAQRAWRGRAWWCAVLPSSVADVRYTGIAAPKHSNARYRVLLPFPDRATRGRDEGRLFQAVGVVCLALGCVIQERSCVMHTVFQKHHGKSKRSATKNKWKNQRISGLVLFYSIHSNCLVCKQDRLAIARGMVWLSAS